MGTPRDSAATRAKIINAAGRLFAERGMKGVTVREIAGTADTHLSALNYHFRSKEALYREVLLEACKSDSISAGEQELLLKLPPRKALFLFVKEAIKTYAGQTPSQWQIALITRECWEPSPVFEEVAAAYFTPETNFIARIIGRVVDKPSDDHEVRFAVIGLIGLLETCGMYGHLIDAVAPGLSDRFNRKDWLVKKLVHLTLEAAGSAPKG